MNVLDENLRQSPRELLASSRIAVRQIGIEVGRSGMQDDEIIALLHQLSRPTFFTSGVHVWTMRSESEQRYDWPNSR